MGRGRGNRGAWPGRDRWGQWALWDHSCPRHHGHPASLTALSDLQDTAYHCLAALFYFSASALETLVTIGLQDDIYKHYSENISAVVSPQFSLSVHSSRRPLMGALSRRVPESSLEVLSSLNSQPSKPSPPISGKTKPQRGELMHPDPLGHSQCCGAQARAGQGSEPGRPLRGQMREGA